MPSMSSFSNKIFTYEEALPTRSLSRLPGVLSFSNISNEAVLFRLLLGTVDIKYNLDLTASIRQRTNYSNLQSVLNKRLSLNSIYNCQVPIKNNKDKINKYFKENRKNTRIYEEVLMEFSNFFYQKYKGSHLAAYVHLYRCLEYISFSFPMIYVSKAGTYQGTYDALKSFFSDQQKSELKFFKKFLSTLLDESILNLQLDIDVKSPNIQMLEQFKSLIKNIADQEKICYTDNGSTISIAYYDLFDLAVTLRNRYFHMLSGGAKNISSRNICVDSFFEFINEYVANWIAFVYFEIVKYGVESL